MDFIRHEVGKGRQAYYHLSLIEESEKLDYEDLMRGYENIKAWFPSRNIGSAWCMGGRQMR